MARGGINKAIVQKARESLLLGERIRASTPFALSWEIPAQRRLFTVI